MLPFPIVEDENRALAVQVFFSGYEGFPQLLVEEIMHIDTPPICVQIWLEAGLCL